MTAFVHVDHRPVHSGVMRFERAIAAIRGIFRNWAEDARREAEANQRWNAALHDARRMADLSRAMNGIAVEDKRRYD